MYKEKDLLIFYDTCIKVLDNIHDVWYNNSMKKIEVIKIKPKTPRNEMHFNVQRNTKAAVFSDKTKYNRKDKHKTFSDLV